MQRQRTVRIRQRRLPVARPDPVTEAALDHAPVGLIVLDRNRRVVRITARAWHLLGRAAAAPTAGMPLRRVLAGSALPAKDAARILASLERDASGPRELQLDIAARAVAVDVRTASGRGWVISLEDVTQSRQMQDWLLEHASSDPVTGLWNSHHFMLLLHDRLLAARSAPGQQQDFVLLVGLYQMQDACGPWSTTTFDMLLRLVAERLGSCLCDGEILARLPDNQFAAALTRPGGPDAIDAACAAISASLALPFTLDGQVIALGARLGVARAPQDGTTPDELIGNAGLALLAAATDDHQDRSAPRWRCFDQTLTERIRARRDFEADLRRALAEGEFELHYQPQVDLHRGRVTGMEALLRWRSARRGLVPPGAFIGLAEQLGLIGAIGEWVLGEACRAASSWPSHITVAVNASPLQFETGDFAASVATALDTTGLPAHRLEVEVTENLLLRSTEPVLRTLAALQALGVRLVLDDFGTGYASLSQLSRFHFDKIKIDRSFVTPSEDSLQHSAIVRSIAALGRSLGIPTIAEGVETARQLEQIKADGCTCVQGYYLSRPIPGAEVIGVIERLNHVRTSVAA